MNILYIEDDKQLAKTIQQKLISHYNVDISPTGKKGIILAENKEYDLFIIDYYLPDQNGIQVCKKIREVDTKTPILVFTTNDTKKDVVEALDAGADDYLTKPFSYQELEARIRALVRRNSRKQPTKQINVGKLTIKLDDQYIVLNKQYIKLPRQEYMLLKYLTTNKGKLVSREELYEHVWGRDDYYNSNTIDVHIRRLRKRLKELVGENCIKSVYGSGYKIYNFQEE